MKREYPPGLRYENLTDEELDRVSLARFNGILRPIKAIGREAVIEELRAYEAIERLWRSAGRCL
jgi:hypothetical protein